MAAGTRTTTGCAAGSVTTGIEESGAAAPKKPAIVLGGDTSSRDTPTNTEESQPLTVLVAGLMTLNQSKRNASGRSTIRRPAIATTFLSPTGKGLYLGVSTTPKKNGLKKTMNSLKVA